MYIVGTAGHIDHGKTSLISALTGVDCDRLPEEKEREMTIDIGFASIDYPKFGKVSIIDVPGHERFIRNMVVGAWGIDLALLVVAVDDGWMPQTEDHFRVLELLGVQRIIVVMNKVDLADDEMLEFVNEEILEKIEETRFAGSVITGVSAKTGSGIEKLREIIVSELRKLMKITDSKKPYMFVDRAFASKGYGTVVTGTLKNGVFAEDDIISVFPVKKEARIKRIESHFSTKTEGSPSQRTALNLSGIAVDDVRRGTVIYKTNFFTESSDVIARLRILNREKEIKNNIGVEILIGTSSIKGKLILIGDDFSDRNQLDARIKFETSWCFYPGEPFVLTSPGGYRILGGGTILMPDYDAAKQKKLVKAELKSVLKTTKEEIINFIISVKGWFTKKNLFAMFPENPKRIEKICAELESEKRVIIMDDYILKMDYFDISVKSIVDSINQKVGMNLKELSDLSRMPAEVTRILLPYILNNFTVIEKDGRYFGADSITEDTLSETRKILLSKIMESGGRGFEIVRITDDQQKKDIKDLIKLDFLISLDGNIIYHRDIYDGFKKKIMDLFNNSEKITVPEAKDAVGLSRKYIIPLLNRIENDGLIKRLGDFRIRV